MLPMFQLNMHDNPLLRLLQHCRGNDETSCDVLNCGPEGKFASECLCNGVCGGNQLGEQFSF